MEQGVPHRGQRLDRVRWLGPLTIAVAFVVLTAWSWQKWCDLIIDFGAELYIAWRLSLGDALYVDIAYRNGPLSPYLNALWFRLFGVSISTLVCCNLAILAGICALIYSVFRGQCGRLVATVVCLFFLATFGFSQYVGVANYNYVTPYQHSQTHGMALSLAMIVALGAHLRRGRLGSLVLAGMCMGLVFLTKVELFVPAAFVALVGLPGVLLTRTSRNQEGGATPRHASNRCAIRVSRDDRKSSSGAVQDSTREGLTRSGDRPRSGLLVMSFAGAALVPIGGAYALLRIKLPVALALEGVLGNWNYLGGDLLADPFYLTVLGFDDPATNALVALRMFLGIAALGAIILTADRLAPASLQRAPLSVPIAVVVFAVLFVGRDRIPWFEFARALPLTTAVAVISLLFLCLRHRRDREALARLAPLALFAVYALVLLGKMILKTRLQHYGFVLAMPASLLLVASLVCGAPWLARTWKGGNVSRAIALAVIGAAVSAFLARSDAIYAQKDHPVGEGGDMVRAWEGRGRVVVAALEELRARMSPSSTLLVLPEGTSLNYWLRRPSPSRYYLFLPAEFAAFGGELVFLENIGADPPDFVALVDRPHAEFGVGPFGLDPANGLLLMKWVGETYQRVRRIGEDPFRDRGFGIVILERRSAVQCQHRSREQGEKTGFRRPDRLLGGCSDSRFSGERRAAG